MTTDGMRFRRPLRFIPRSPEPPGWRYVLAVSYTAAAFLVRYSLDPLLKDHSPLLIFALAVALSAIRGFGPGVTATCLGALGSAFFFPPIGDPFRVDPEYRPTAVVQVVAFLAVGYILSWVGGELRRSRWSAVQLARERDQILNSITDGFVATDADWNLIYLNERAAGFACCSVQEAFGKNIYDCIPEWRSSVVEDNFREAVKTQSAIQFEYQWPGSDRWFDFHLHPGESNGLTGYFSDITERKRADERLREMLAQRDKALAQVHVLTGLLPICAGCKRIRDESGEWQQLESYISAHTQAQFSHGLCVECARQYMDDLR